MYARMLVAGVAITGGSCSGRTTAVSTEPSATKALTTTTTGDAAPTAPPDCTDPIVVMEAGRERAQVCADAVPPGLTVIDLRDAWTPRLFAPGPDGVTPAFRDSYLALAAERGPDGKPLPPTSALTELYGVVPSFAIVRQRLANATRHACHARHDPAPIAKLTRPYGQEHASLIRHHAHQRRVLGRRLETARTQRQLPDYAAFATDRELGPHYERWKAADEIYGGMIAAQRRLACEGVLPDKDVDGTFSWAMGHALELFQRRHFLIPNYRLDADTRAALATAPRELDFRFALRVLRERVVDATGLIEDGSAGAGPQPILGRTLDAAAMRTTTGHGRPLPDAAPDLVGAATEAAARQLGWTTPDAVEAFLVRHRTGVRVALALPPPPAYHAPHMELFAEIDRGDVWYDEQPAKRVAWRRPTLVLYVKDGAVKRPLIRWATTIGGWSAVRVGGATVQRWKESDVGPRVWRDLFAAPTWLPPWSTPDQELVRWVSAGRWELRRSIVGPGPQGAFGMMLLPHYRVTGSGKAARFVTNGIGTHGSASVSSIVNGTSHGCHRLYNQLAVRLGAFLLRHRDHVVKGQQPEHYRRTVRAMGSYRLNIDTRGFLYELTPPVPVEVLAGNIRSPRKVPPRASAPAGAE